MGGCQSLGCCCSSAGENHPAGTLGCQVPFLPQPSPTPGSYGSSKRGNPNAFILQHLALIYFRMISNTCPCWFSRLLSQVQGLRSPSALHSRPPLLFSRNNFTPSLSINFSVLLGKLPVKYFHRRKGITSPLYSPSLTVPSKSLKYLDIERHILLCCISA